MWNPFRYIHHKIWLNLWPSIYRKESKIQLAKESEGLASTILGNAKIHTIYKKEGSNNTINLERSLGATNIAEIIMHYEKKNEFLGSIPSILGDGEIKISYICKKDDKVADLFFSRDEVFSNISPEDVIKIASNKNEEFVNKHWQKIEGRIKNESHVNLLFKKAIINASFAVKVLQTAVIRRFASITALAQIVIGHNTQDKVKKAFNDNFQAISEEKKLEQPAVDQTPESNISRFALANKDVAVKVLTAPNLISDYDKAMIINKHWSVQVSDLPKIDFKAISDNLYQELLPAFEKKTNPSKIKNITNYLVFTPVLYGELNPVEKAKSINLFYKSFNSLPAPLAGDFYNLSMEDSNAALIFAKISVIANELWTKNQLLEISKKYYETKFFITDFYKDLRAAKVKMTSLFTTQDFFDDILKNYPRIISNMSAEDKIEIGLKFDKEFIKKNIQHLLSEEISTDIDQIKNLFSLFKDDELLEIFIQYAEKPDFVRNLVNYLNAAEYPLSRIINKKPNSFIRDPKIGIPILFRVRLANFLKNPTLFRLLPEDQQSIKSLQEFAKYLQKEEFDTNYSYIQEFMPVITELAANNINEAKYLFSQSDLMDIITAQQFFSIIYRDGNNERLKLVDEKTINDKFTSKLFQEAIKGAEQCLSIIRNKIYTNVFSKVEQRTILLKALANSIAWLQSLGTQNEKNVPNALRIQIDELSSFITDEVANDKASVELVLDIGGTYLGALNISKILKAHADTELLQKIKNKSLGPEGALIDINKVIQNEIIQFSYFEITSEKSELKPAEIRKMEDTAEAVGIFVNDIDLLKLLSPEVLLEILSVYSPNRKKAEENYKVIGFKPGTSVSEIKKALKSFARANKKVRVNTAAGNNDETLKLINYEKAGNWLIKNVIDPILLPLNYIVARHEDKEFYNSLIREYTEGKMPEIIKIGDQEINLRKVGTENLEAAKLILTEKALYGLLLEEEYDAIKTFVKEKDPDFLKNLSQLQSQQSSSHDLSQALGEIKNEAVILQEKVDFATNATKEDKSAKTLEANSVAAPQPSSPNKKTSSVWNSIVKALSPSKQKSNENNVATSEQAASNSFTNSKRS